MQINNTVVIYYINITYHKFKPILISVCSEQKFNKIIIYLFVLCTYHCEIFYHRCGLFVTFSSCGAVSVLERALHFRRCAPLGCPWVSQGGGGGGGRAGGHYTWVGESSQLRLQLLPHTATGKAVVSRWRWTWGPSDICIISQAHLPSSVLLLTSCPSPEMVFGFTCHLALLVSWKPNHTLKSTWYVITVCADCFLLAPNKMICHALRISSTYGIFIL